MRYFYIIALFLVFSACNYKQQNSNIKNTSFDKNDSVLITYYRGLIETNVAVSCEKLAAFQEQHPKNRYVYLMENGELVPFPVLLIDTFIVDSSVTQQIIRLLDNKVKADDFNEDARMYVTIKRSNGNIDYLCFDHFPYHAKYNGQSCSLDKEMLFLLRYYSGYYSWFEESNLKRFEELKDMTLYQKALEQIKMNKWNNSNTMKNLVPKAPRSAQTLPASSGYGVTSPLGLPYP